MIFEVRGGGLNPRHDLFAVLIGGLFLEQRLEELNQLIQLPILGFAKQNLCKLELLCIGHISNLNSFLNFPFGAPFSERAYIVIKLITKVNILITIF